MKNLLIYISPTKSFNNPRNDLAANDATTLVKVQIEQSMALGWDAKDIMLVTNFPFKYGDIESLVLPDVEFVEHKPQVSKINAIVKLFEDGQIKKRELYWFHDLDAFQLEKIAATEIEIKANEIAMTDFGGAKFFLGTDRWSGGIIYFKNESYDIFKRIQELCHQKKIDEEEAFGILCSENPYLAKRIKKINNTYNFIGYNLLEVYSKSIKPLKVVHFHPTTTKKRFGGANALRYFLGENPLGTNFLTSQLIKTLRFHRLQANVIPGGISIIIPTYKRAHKLVSVYKNAKESSPLISQVYFVVEQDDTDSIKVLTENNLPYFINERTRNYAGAFNTGYLKTKEKYIFNGSDDLYFKPGWLEEAFKRIQSGFKVVGTNDLHHRHVVKGILSTHNLFDRKYIETLSGTFDEQNIVFTEKYKHNFIDREFVELAKFRGVFSACLEAKVEHMHWMFGLSERDQTYDKQNGTERFDKDLYRSRYALYSKLYQNQNT